MRNAAYKEGKVRIDGLDALEKALRELPVSMSGHNGGPLRKATREAVNNILKQAVLAGDIPEDTGHLKKSVTVSITSAHTRNAALKGGSSFEGYVLGLKNGYNPDAPGEGKHKGKAGTPIGAYAYSLIFGPGVYPKAARWHKQAKDIIGKPWHASKMAMVEYFKQQLKAHIERYAAQEAAKAPKK